MLNHTTPYCSELQHVPILPQKKAVAKRPNAMMSRSVAMSSGFRHGEGMNSGCLFPVSKGGFVSLGHISIEQLDVTQINQMKSIVRRAPWVDPTAWLRTSQKLVALVMPSRRRQCVMAI